MSKKHRSKTIGPDRSVLVPQREKVKLQLHIRERSDYTEKQKVILETALEKQTRCIFIDGIWGTTKSFLCVLAALRLLNAGKVKGITYIRNPIEASAFGKVGLLPGSLSERMEPYNAILYEKLDELLPKNEIDFLANDERVKCLPLSFVRGRSWNCEAIIVDEAASMTYDDLLLLLSRCGEFTRIFFIADTACQNELGSKSGFGKMFQMFNDRESMENGVFCFELKEREDILRSGFLRFIMEKTGVLKRI